jgi:hypothetical protein
MSTTKTEKELKDDVFKAMLGHSTGRQFVIDLYDALDILVESIRWKHNNDERY